jgi:hypothetical protein
VVHLAQTVSIGCVEDLRTVDCEHAIVTTNIERVDRVAADDAQGFRPSVVEIKGEMTKLLQPRNL